MTDSHTDEPRVYFYQGVFIAPPQIDGGLWENGGIESFNAWLLEELLIGEIF